MSAAWRWQVVVGVSCSGLALASPDESLLRLCLQKLQAPCEVRLTLRNPLPPECTTKAGGTWDCQVINSWQSPVPRVRLEQQFEGVRRSWVTAFRKEVRRPAWIATVDLPTGSLVRSANFELQQRWGEESSTSERPLWNFQCPGQWRLRRPLTAGSPLDPNRLEAVPVCEPGCGITLHFQGEGLRGTMSARALEKGFPGRSLRVRLENGTTILAFCDERGTFSIEETMKP